ncbi:MAG: zinc-dependent alcohol dehydrogenase family protein [Mariprofundales bacterium]
MQAMMMHQTGDVNVLQWQSCVNPRPKAGEVLVHLYAASVNPVDTKLRKNGTYAPEIMPAILGCDGAGVVCELGKGVQHICMGQHVYFCYGGIGFAAGCYAEYVCVPAEVLAHKPESISYIEAAAAPLVLLTAWESLFDRARLSSDKTLYIAAGAGGVGHVAIQLAKRVGALVATSVSTTKKAAFVRSLGVDHVIMYKQKNVADDLLEWTNGRGVDVAFDTVGGDTLEQLFPAIAPYGDIVSILEPSSNIQWHQARVRNLRFSLELMLSPMHKNWTVSLRHQADILRRCATLIDEQKLCIHVQQVFPLSAVASAHQLLEQGGMMGKLALEIVTN